MHLKTKILRQPAKYQITAKCNTNAISVSPKTISLSRSKDYIYHKNGYSDTCNSFFLKLTDDKVINCMFLSCHVRVSEWIHTL